MRIACVHGNINVGGADKMIVNLANALMENNNEVFFYTVENDNNHNFSLNKSIKYVCIKKKSKLPKTQFIFNILNLRKQVKKDKIDIVISFLYPLNIMSLISMAGLQTKVLISERGNPEKQPNSGIWKFLRDKTYSCCEGIVYQTDGARNYYKNIIRGKGIIIQNPVVSNEHRPFGGERDKVIVNVGRLDGHKNQKRLIYAFSLIKDEFPDYTLRIFGDGDLRDELLAHAQSLDLSKRLDFAGMQNNIPNKIKNATMFVLSSDYEGMPNALIEAMAVGLPCVSTDCAPGGARELIQNGFNGLLCELDEGESLAEAMRRILLDEDLAQHLSENARKITQTNSKEIIFEQWIDYINEIVGTDNEKNIFCN